MFSRILSHPAITRSFSLHFDNMVERCYTSMAITSPFGIVKGVRSFYSTEEQSMQKKDPFSIADYAIGAPFHIILNTIDVCGATGAYFAVLPIVLPFTVYGAYRGNITMKTLKDHFITVETSN